MRVFWASYVVHHSSQHYNLSTALRQTWTPMTALPFWAPRGLTRNIRTFRPTHVAFHEFADLARDVRAAASWRERLGYVFRGPGWSPDGTGGGTRG